jgi:hypothetical protein
MILGLFFSNNNDIQRRGNVLDIGSDRFIELSSQFVSIHRFLVNLLTDYHGKAGYVLLFLFPFTKKERRGSYMWPIQQLSKIRPSNPLTLVHHTLGS